MIATLLQKTAQIEIDVFKTTVRRKEDAAKIVSLLNEYFPNHLINFDLDDCDKILRIEGVENNKTFIKNALGQHGFFCEALI